MKIDTLQEIYNKKKEIKINSLCDLYDLKRPEFLKYQLEIIKLTNYLRSKGIEIETFGLSLDKFNGNNSMSCRLWEYILIYLNIYTLPESRIIEIGCGSSIFPIWLATKGCKEVVAYDISSSAIEILKQAKRELNLNNLIPICGDASDMSRFKDNYFDSVSSVCCIEHIQLEKQAQALKEWTRICKYKLGLTFDYGNGMDYPFRNYQEVEDRIMKVLRETGMQQFGNLAYNLNPAIVFSSSDFTFGSLFFEKVRKCNDKITTYNWDKMDINKNIKLSCYMVIKDEERFVEYAIKSVIHDIDELIIVDTGSTDKTFPIAEYWQKQVPSKIKLYKFEIKGYDLSEVRNYAMSLCTGDWILIVDGDEVWTKEELVKVKKVISNAGDKIGFRPLSVRPLISFNKCEYGIYMERIYKNRIDIEYKGIYPSDLMHHKEIPIYLYVDWVDIHYFHLASMKAEQQRFDKWALYHKLSNPERTWEQCQKTARDVWHANGKNPNARPCPYPIPEVLQEKLNGGKEWKD